MVPLIVLILINSALNEPGSVPSALWLTPDQIKTFADYLFNEKDYLRAAGEYERYLILSGKNNDPELLFIIGRCYRLANRPERARAYFAQIDDESLKDRAAYEIAESYFQEGNYAQSINYIKTNGYADDSRFHPLMIKNLLFLKDFASARALAQRQPTGTQLDSITLATFRLSYRNPAVAGLLSTVIPGLGKGYSGRWSDALFSFAVIGITGFQAYDGFRRDGIRSTKGWIYGSMFLVFYIGDIYGSLVAAKQYNQNLTDRILSQVHSIENNNGVSP